MEINNVYQGNCKDLLKEIPNNFIDLTVTSPPYDNLRNYEGCEWNMDVFKEVAKELYRVTKEGGIVVWVINDSTNNGSESGNSFRQALFFMDCGFNLHDTMIYAKRNYVPLTHNRYEQQFEYMFVFTKGKPKTFNPIKIKCVTAGTNRSYSYVCATTKENSAIRSGRQDKTIIKEDKFKPNIWFYDCGKGNTSKDKYVFEHPATFPEKLAYDHIISWSNEEDIVLDPFAGSGTTLKMAKLLKRNYLGFEISEKYVSLINKRKSQESILAHFDVTQALATQESLNRNLKDFSSENKQKEDCKE